MAINYVYFILFKLKNMKTLKKKPMVLLPEVSKLSFQSYVLNGRSTFFVNLRALSIINIEKSFGQNHFLNRDTRQLMTNVMILSAFSN